MKYYFKCPRCGNDDKFIKPDGSNDGSGTGCLLFLFGGLIPLLIFNSYNKPKILCPNCNLLLAQPPIPSSPISKGLQIVLLFLFLAFLTTTIFLVFPEIVEQIPKYPAADIGISVIAEHPRAIFYGMFPVLGLLIIFCVLRAIRADWRFKNDFREQWKTKPVYKSYSNYETVPHPRDNEKS